MCRLKDVNVNITKITFEKRGYITFYLDDRRIIFQPVSVYPPVRRLNAKQRKKYVILDGQFFSFDDITEAYCIKDVLKL